jgi:hypothetical protein
VVCKVHHSLASSVTADSFVDPNPPTFHTADRWAQKMKTHVVSLKHDKMINKLFFLLLFLGLYSCTPPKYITKRQSEIVNLDLDNSITNYIPIADEDLNKSKILDSSYNLIIFKKYSELKSYLNSLEASGVSSSDFYLVKTLLLITQKEYSDAITSLRKINDSDYTLLKRLLSNDLIYEITRIKGQSNYDSFLKNYQDLIDSYPDNNSLKKIVAIRLRYLRYNY